MKPEQLQAVIRRLGGTATAGELVDAGARWGDIYALRDEGTLIELSRGIYRIADAAPTTYLDLVAVCRRAPHGAICLNSAASYWDLTDEMPSRVHCAVARGRRRPSIAHPPTRIHVFAAGSFEIERLHQRMESGDEIAIYSRERTVVDLMRLRRQVGADQALGALRRYLEQPRARPGRVLELARRLRVGNAVGDALETLMA